MNTPILVALKSPATKSIPGARRAIAAQYVIELDPDLESDEQADAARAVLASEIFSSDVVTERQVETVAQCYMFYPATFIGLKSTSASRSLRSTRP